MGTKSKSKRMRKAVRFTRRERFLAWFLEARGLFTRVFAAAIVIAILLGVAIGVSINLAHAQTGDNPALDFSNSLIGFVCTNANQTSSWLAWAILLVMGHIFAPATIAKLESRGITSGRFVYLLHVWALRPMPSAPKPPATPAA